MKSNWCALGLIWLIICTGCSRSILSLSTYSLIFIKTNIEMIARWVKTSTRIMWMMPLFIWWWLNGPLIMLHKNGNGTIKTAPKVTVWSHFAVSGTKRLGSNCPIINNSNIAPAYNHDVQKATFRPVSLILGKYRFRIKNQYVDNGLNSTTGNTNNRIPSIASTINPSSPVPPL